MRILHTADWHLGRIFHNIHLTNDQEYVLQQIQQIAIEQKIDLILVSGDIYDRAVPPPDAVKLLDDTLCNLLFGAKIPVIMLSGNHDSSERLSFGSRLFSFHGLHLVGQLKSTFQPITLHDNYGPVNFYAVPYAEPSIVREKLKQDDLIEHNDAMGAIINSISIDQSVRNIFCGHAFVTGGISSESERPISIGGSGFVHAALFDNFTCALFGHLHGHQWIQDKIHYPGSILKYSFSEVNHQKTVTIIDIDKKGLIKSDYLPLLPRHNVRCISGFLTDILKNAKTDSSPEDYLLITILDREPVLDLLDKLRIPYPNVLTVQKTAIESMLHNNSEFTDYRKLSDEDLFAAFVSQISGTALTDEQRTYFASIVEVIRKKERESA
jgi:exonuclease SbcD